MMRDILPRINTVKSLSQELKEYTEQDIPNSTRQEEPHNFINSDRYNATKNVLSNARANPVLAIQSHCTLMHGLVLHVNKCRTEGEIMKMTKMDYSAGNETVNEKLERIEEKMNDTIVSMKIFLAGQNATSEHDTTQEVLTAHFLSYNNNTFTEYYRVYKLMNDSMGIMDYLKAVYIFIANVPTSQNSWEHNNSANVSDSYNSVTTTQRT